LVAKCPVFIESALRQGASIIPDIFEHRRIKELEKRVADLEHLVGWVTGLLIDFVAVVIAIGAAIFVAGDYRLSGWLGSPCVYGHFARVKFHFSEGCQLVFLRPARYNQPSNYPSVGCGP
jgi:hypothetical protein